MYFDGWILWEYVWVTGVEASHVCAKFSHTRLHFGAVARPPLHKRPLACARSPIQELLTSGIQRPISLLVLLLLLQLL